MFLSAPVYRRAAAAAVGCLIPVGLAIPASAALAAPTNLSPSDTTSSHSPLLSWSRASGATRYEVQVDNNADFSSPIFTATTTNGHIVPDKVLPTGSVSWRVRALSTTAASGWAGQNFDITAVGAPTPQAPVDGAQLAQPDDPPTFTWTAVQGAVKYTVQVDETSTLR